MATACTRVNGESVPATALLRDECLLDKTTLIMPLNFNFLFLRVLSIELAAWNSSSCFPGRTVGHHARCTAAVPSAGFVVESSQLRRFTAVTYVTLRVHAATFS
jgi:hypothetical protein